jgi:hypothetical protein
MMGSILGHDFSVFFFFTIWFMGGASFLMGRAIAKTWRSGWWVCFYSCGLGVVDRFLVYALFQGELLAVFQYVLDTSIIFIIGLMAYRLNFVSVLVRQYPWIYERTTWLTYRILATNPVAVVSTERKR